MVEVVGAKATDNVPLAIVAPTPRGYRLALDLQQGCRGAQVWTKQGTDQGDRPNVFTYSNALKDCIAERWRSRQPLVFILTVGAVVRTIAPFLEDKATDPPVVAIDETGRHVISLSGGHQAGADALARQLAALLGVEAIVSSASEGQDLPAIDTLGQPFGWRAGPSDWLGVARALTQMEAVGVVQTCGWQLWREELPDWHNLLAISEDDLSTDRDRAVEIGGYTLKALLWIGDRRSPTVSIPIARWHPRVLWVGIGCERGTSLETLAEGLENVFQRLGLAREAIAALVSLDLKRDEPGLIALAERLDVPFRCFSPETLDAIAVPNPSETVRAAVGTGSVAEAAALKAADGPLVVEKQVFRSSDGACTLAIARSEVEYTPRTGKLFLIGTGPGNLAQLTPAARSALSQCDAVIGYQLYVDLVRPLLHSTQIIEATPITQEVTRAKRAINLASRGLTVAVISSGDCGIYGMAGLVLECLAQSGWDGDRPQVEVLPGISALQAAAARIGAPLMHDFCAISLSDLLTPWETILKRLEAAARADFVVALYNPRSRHRTQQIEFALTVFRTYRSPDTPVAIARSVYRTEENIGITTLAEVDVEVIDMLTVVLIGNQSTFRWGDRLITPRGYGTQSV